MTPGIKHLRIIQTGFEISKEMLDCFPILRFLDSLSEAWTNQYDTTGKFVVLLGFTSLDVELLTDLHNPVETKDQTKKR